MIELELTEPFHVTAGYTGQPGDRTFFIQAESRDHRVTVLVEKAQVEGLGEMLARLLARLDDAPATDWDRGSMDLRPPIEPRWRAGDISVGVDEEEHRFLLELSEFVPDDAEPNEIRLWMNKDQARRLSAHASEVVGEGRPRCELCGRPEGPDGAHVCPATNGHGALSR